MLKHKDIIDRLTLDEKAYLLSGRDFWNTLPVPEKGIPSIRLSDGPHGIRRPPEKDGGGNPSESIPATCFPTASAIANSWDEALGEEIGRCLGEEAACQDVSVLLGPGLNMKRSPLCGRNFEYFSEDPFLAGKMAAAYIRGIQENGLSACPKHFAANNMELRRMASDSVVDERTLREIYLTGFEIAVKEGHPGCLMASYNRVNGTYSNENEELLQKILRDEWGFDGFVVSDWGACNDFTEGVRAGSNLEMPGTGGDGPEKLIRDCRAGKISEELIDKRVDELLDVVLRTRKAADQYKGKDFDRQKHHELAMKACESSVVLLKNENRILPLKNKARVAVIGDFAARARYQGAGSSLVNATDPENAMDVIGNFDLEVAGFEQGFRRNGEEDPEMEERAAALSKTADYVLLYLGLDEISEAEGLDRPHMRLPENQVKLLEAVSKANPNVIVILAAGSPVEMPWLENCRALLHGYLSGQAGASAILKCVTGEVNPSGKLSETCAVKYEDYPSAPYFPARERNAEYREGLYIGYRYFETAKIPVTFPFGFGLSYTSFSYSNLTVTEKEARFTLTNTGDADGAEIAELYVHAEKPSVYRPEKELKGFRKVFLKAGESREVVIPLDDKAFRYFNVKTGRFETDGGGYKILIGASVQDIRLSASIHVRGTDAELPKNARIPAYVKADIKSVPDDAFRRLLGHDIPDGRWSGELQMNDAIAQMYYAKSMKARIVWQYMSRSLDRNLASEKPDLGAVFTYNMPFRGIGKLSGGKISQEMCEGVLTMVNGHAAAFVKGLSKLVKGYFKQRKARNKLKQIGS